MGEWVYTAQRAQKCIVWSRNAFSPGRIRAQFYVNESNLSFSIIWFIQRRCQLVQTAEQRVVRRLISNELGGMRKEAVVTKAEDLFQDMPGKSSLRISDLSADIQTREPLNANQEC
jgi:hypothetical protein